MRFRSAGLALMPGLLAAAGCASECEGSTCEAAPLVAVAEDGSPAVLSGPEPETSGEELAAAIRSDTSTSDPVPKALLGTWTYSHIECDEDMLANLEGPYPENRDIRAQVTFAADRTYEMDVEGFRSFGSYRYEASQLPHITLDTALNFVVVHDVLQNWSEGDATYVCGRVFMRKPL